MDNGAGRQYTASSGCMAPDIGRFWSFTAREHADNTLYLSEEDRRGSGVSWRWAWCLVEVEVVRDSV